MIKIRRHLVWIFKILLTPMLILHSILKNPFIFNQLISWFIKQLLNLLVFCKKNKTEIFKTQVFDKEKALFNIIYYFVNWSNLYIYINIWNVYWCLNIHKFLSTNNYIMQSYQNLIWTNNWIGNCNYYN